MIFLPLVVQHGEDVENKNVGKDVQGKKSWLRIRDSSHLFLICDGSRSELSSAAAVKVEFIDSILALVGLSFEQFE